MRRSVAGVGCGCHHLGLPAATWSSRSATAVDLLFAGNEGRNLGARRIPDSDVFSGPHPPTLPVIISHGGRCCVGRRFGLFGWVAHNAFGPTNN